MTPDIKPFFKDPALDFQARGLLGRAVSGCTEIGEVLSTLPRIRKVAQWGPEMAVTAARVRAIADGCLKSGHVVSAGGAYLRAATYYAASVDGYTTQPDSPQLLESFRAHRACWDAFIDCGKGVHVRLDVPFEGTTLPGYLLRPDASGAKRRTFVMTNGSDGAISDMWGAGAFAALARDYNVFLYDGPGQQSTLFERGMKFRHDWEAVLTPVVDTLVARAEVDASRLAAYGISQAGYWLPRALAFEHRFVAAIPDPGVVDVGVSWTSHLGATMLRWLDRDDAEARAKFNSRMKLAEFVPSVRRMLEFRSRPYAHADWYELFREVRRYVITPELAAKIRTPMLIPDPEDEQFFPGDSARLAKMVPGRAELVAFTREEGANFHCQPMGRALTDQRMFDWLDARFANSR